MQSNASPESDIRETLGMAAAPGGKRLFRRMLYPGLILLVGLCLFIFWKTQNGAETLKYETQKVLREDLTIIVSATGNLEPTNQVDVGSELSGIIETVEVDYNDHVSVNQVLARLDTDKPRADVTKYQAALETARAEVLQAQAVLQDKETELARLRHAHDLSGGKLPSAYNLEAAEAARLAAEADLAAARARVKQAEAVLEYAETDLAKAVIRSPVNGIVLSRDVEPGQTVAASLQAPVLFTLAEDLTRMELHVDVDEADVGRVREGQPAVFTVDAYPERSFPARITQVRYGAQTTEGVVTYETVLEVDNEALLLRPGMTATADITVAGVRQALLVPNAALRFSPPQPSGTGAAEKKKAEDGSFTSKLIPRPPRRDSNSPDAASDKTSKNNPQVWVLKEGKPFPFPVATGLSDGIRTEITGGSVRPGMEVIVGAKKVES